MRDAGINPDEPFEAVYRVFAGQNCIEIKAKEKDTDV
jgi:hypothetical protein